MKKSTKTAAVSKPVAKKEISIVKEEKSIKLGQITKDGFEVKTIFDDGRVLLSNKDCAKVVNSSEVK